MPMMDDSDSSGLSEHSDKEIQKLAPIFLKARQNHETGKTVKPIIKSSPPKPKRAPSPPHEEVLADNPDIAFLVMFRSRFNDAMPSKLPNLGPQDIERGVVESSPSPEVSQLLCTLLALVLNRKKPVERGHHGRALEEAVLSHKKDWPKSWMDTNPLHGGKNFENMTPVERLNLLRTLVMWALSDSEAIQTIIKDKYKQQRHSDDENQPLSVQPWGFDGDKRRYFLVQGLDDTSFRIYREGDRYKKTAHWWSVAGSIDEAKELAKKMEEVDGSQAARRFAGKITNAIPMFEATEEKRRRREYRQIRRAAFTRPEPGFSLYEGRTRGKRARYVYDDEDAFLSDATSTRRSARQSGRSTPFEAMPTTTMSGRQVRQPRTGEYGESLLSGPPMNTDELAPGYSDTEGDGMRSQGRSGTEDSEQPPRGGGRATRSAFRPAMNGSDNPRKRKHIDTYNSIDEMSDEESGASGDEWDSDKNEAEDEHMPDVHNDQEDDDMSEADEESEDEDQEPRSLILRLKVPSAALSNISNGTTTPQSTASPALGAAETGISGLALDEPGSLDTLRADGDRPQQQPGSSPMGPSAYPTPTSSSFLPPEHKIVAPAPAVQSVAYPGFATKADGPLLSNGVHRIEEHSKEPERRPQSLSFQNHHAHPSAGAAWPSAGN